MIWTECAGQFVPSAEFLALQYPASIPINHPPHLKHTRWLSGLGMNICVQRGPKKTMTMTLEEEVFTYSEFNVSLGYSIIQQQLYWNDNAINLIMILSDAFS